jgi:hypothetical protein
VISAGSALRQVNPSLKKSTNYIGLEYSAARPRRSSTGCRTRSMIYVLSATDYEASRGEVV